MISIRPAWASQECKRNQKTYSLAWLAIILDVSWRNCKWQRTRMPQSFDVKGPAGCDLVEDTIGSGPLRLFRKWTILPERFLSTSKAKSEGKNNPWHLRLYSYCINWTHYAMIGFFCWGFFSVFFFPKMSVSLIQTSSLRAVVFIQATGPDAWIPTPSSRVHKTLNENGRNQSNNVGRAGIHPNLLHTLA